MGKFAVKETATGIKFNLLASNGQVIGVSEVYSGKEACLKGIESVRKNAEVANLEEQKKGVMQKIFSREVRFKADDGSAELAAFASYDNETRADIFGRLEYAFLSFFTTTPMYYRNSASLVSQKGDYAISDYVDLIGFGGLAFYTYNYDDTQWAEVVKNGLTY